MNHACVKKLLPFLAVGGLALSPVGCAGQDDTESIDLLVDDTPIDREGVAGIHSYAGILKAVQPAVVSVYSERMLEDLLPDDHPELKEFFGERGIPRERIRSGVGSGVIVSPRGYVITNNHVIEGADRIIVQLADLREVEAEVVGRDPATDIAVLRIHSMRQFPAVILADSDQIEVGDVVFALGNALGIGHAVTSGIISARGRTGIGILGEDGYEDFIQTDASMNVGNSGGPLVDSIGRVIGINTAIASPGGGNVGIGFAIPINMASEVMRSLIETGEVRRGYLGLTMRDPERGPVEGPVEYGAPERGGAGDPIGVLVVNVADDGPAARAGLEEGDALVELDGEPIGSASELRLKVAQRRPGRNVELGVVRNGEQLQLFAILGQKEKPAEASLTVSMEAGQLLPGLTVVPLTPELRKTLEVSEEVEGLLVTEVAEDSPHRTVLPVGSIIVQINEETVADLESAREAMNEGQNLFLMLHEGSFHYLLIEEPLS